MIVNVPRFRFILRSSESSWSVSMVMDHYRGTFSDQCKEHREQWRKFITTGSIIESRRVYETEVECLCINPCFNNATCVISEPHDKIPLGREDLNMINLPCRQVLLVCLSNSRNWQYNTMWCLGPSDLLYLILNMLQLSIYSSFIPLIQRMINIWIIWFKIRS